VETTRIGPEVGMADTMDVRREELAARLKALGHPARLHIVELIHERGGEICVCEFAPRLGLSQPTISHHLKVLREAGLIESRQEGTWVYHTIRRAAVSELLDAVGSWSRAVEVEAESASACCAPGAAEPAEEAGLGSPAVS